MIHPPDNRPGVVRDGQRAPVTCSACGCRLEAAVDGTYMHFGRFAGRDARGCRVDCIENVHDATGRAVAALPA